MTCAGTGRDLEEARKPQYRETSRGRAALISVSTGNRSNEWAGLPKAAIKGRPGVNPLRAQFKYGIDKAAAHQLRRIIEELRIDYKQFDRVDGEMRLQFPELSASRSAPAFVESGSFEISSTCHSADLEANLRSVREARAMADLTIVSHHFSVSDGPRGDAPPGFVTQFARACIDAGADIYFGHGWHRTLGIEIYKGKPIFYGVGNFFAQSEFLDPVPSDSYESWGHDPDRLTTLNPAVEPLHPHLDEPTWWSTVLFELTMSDRGVSEIRLHPVSLGRDACTGEVVRPVGSGARRKTDGRPFTASAPDAAIILGRIATMSAALGTAIQLHENGHGICGLWTDAARSRPE
jgi:poly-gamma-glutamate synthesis protein (capsule biosynthesis protein)